MFIRWQDQTESTSDKRRGIAGLSTSESTMLHLCSSGLAILAFA